MRKAYQLLGNEIFWCCLKHVVAMFSKIIWSCFRNSGCTNDTDWSVITFCFFFLFWTEKCHDSKLLVRNFFRAKQNTDKLRTSSTINGIMGQYPSFQKTGQVRPGGFFHLWCVHHWIILSQQKKLCFYPIVSFWTELSHCIQWFNHFFLKKSIRYTLFGPK